MTDKREADQTTAYQIRVKGILDHSWSDWFDGMTIIPQDQDETIISGPVVDQAALQGMLWKISDLGLTIISVLRIEDETH